MTGTESRQRRWSRFREGLRGRPALELGYRALVGLVGTTVLIVGIIAIPYPGPGWAIVFIGLAILATEFEWARRLLGYARRRYNDVMDWFHRQHIAVQALGGVFTALVVVATLWLLGAVDWGAELVGIDWSWLNSPLGIGS